MAYCRCERLESAIVSQVDTVSVSKICKTGAQAAGIDISPAVLLFVLHDQHRAAAAEQLNDIQPVVKIRVLFSVIGHQQVQRTARKKELMRGMIDFLASEVPAVDLKVPLDKLL